LSQGILRVEAQVTAEESLIDTVQFWVGNELRDQVINQRRESLETREFFLWNLTDEHFRGVQSIAVRANNFDGRWGQAARILKIVDDRPANIFTDAGTILRPRDTVMARVEGIRIARAVLLVDDKEVESVAVPDSSSLIQFALPGEVLTATPAQGALPVVRIAGYDASGNKVSDELVSVPSPEK